MLLQVTWFFFIHCRYYSFGLPVPTEEQCSPQQPRRCFYNTITDPCFPVFRQDGLPLSQSLFDEQLANHYRALDSKPTFKVSVINCIFYPELWIKIFLLKNLFDNLALSILSSG